MRRVFVDASAFSALAGIDHAELLRGIGGRVVVPAVVQVEIAQGPAGGALERAIEDRWIGTSRDPIEEAVAFAAEQLGRGGPTRSFDGSVEVLAPALGADDPVVVTDDRPLRRTCKALSIPRSGSIGVVIAAVERGDLEPNEAKDALVGMDGVGARLSARLLRKAERLIDGAAMRRGE